MMAGAFVGWIAGALISYYLFKDIVDVFKDRTIRSINDLERITKYMDAEIQTISESKKPPKRLKTAFQLYHEGEI